MKTVEWFLVFLIVGVGFYFSTEISRGINLVLSGEFSWVFGLWPLLIGGLIIWVFIIPVSKFVISKVSESKEDEKKTKKEVQEEIKSGSTKFNFGASRPETKNETENKTEDELEDKTENEIKGGDKMSMVKGEITFKADDLEDAIKVKRVNIAEQEFKGDLILTITETETTIFDNNTKEKWVFPEQNPEYYVEDYKDTQEYANQETDE